MNDSALANLLSKYMGQTQEDPKGDYEEFLANYMNMQNQNEMADLPTLLESIEGKRRNEMADYGESNKTLNRNSFTMEQRDKLNRLLRGE